MYIRTDIRCFNFMTIHKNQVFCFQQKLYPFVAYCPPSRATQTKPQSHK